jgi:hypothetical protein
VLGYGLWEKWHCTTDGKGLLMWWRTWEVKEDGKVQSNVEKLKDLHSQFIFHKMQKSEISLHLRQILNFSISCVYKAIYFNYHQNPFWANRGHFLTHYFYAIGTI